MSPGSSFSYFYFKSSNVSPNRMRMTNYSYIPILLLLLLSISSTICNDNYNDPQNMKICEDKNEELLHRLERLERIFNITQFNPDLDNVSILELLFVNLQDKISRMIPKTDDICKFNWITGKCNPKCICGYRPKLGDYSPSRSCRLLSKDEIDSNCDTNLHDIPWIVKTSDNIKRFIEQFNDYIKENAPPTDNDCTFSLRDFKCVPENICTLKYKFGDYNINRVCRLRYGDTYNEDDEINLNSIGSIDMDRSQKESDDGEDDDYEFEGNQTEREDDQGVESL